MTIQEREVQVRASEDIAMNGSLALPDGASGLVLFAHGSGSSRFSPRNRYVAEVLQRAGLGSLLFDLLTADEEEEERETRHLRFDIGLLARRLLSAANWAAGQPETRGLALGYFGSSTGAAAALVAAAHQPSLVAAVVSRGGRPDLAGAALPLVQAPTLLIVGGADLQVLRLNREAFESLRGDKRLEVVPGATHLFEEPGTLEQVAALASVWFSHHLTAHAQTTNVVPPEP